MIPFRTPVLVLLLGLLATLPARATAPAPQAPLADFVGHLEARLPALMARYSVPGVVVALVHEGEPAWRGAYGLADRERGRPMTRDALFRAESISKSLTAWAVLQLVEQGRLRLDDPVQAHLRTLRLPPSASPAEALTVRHLLSHTGGLPLGRIGVRYSPGEAMPALRDEVAAEARRLRPPGEAFLYSNVGYHLLEVLIEDVTGERFAEHLARAVLQPLGMTDATFTWREGLRERMPVGYDLEGHAVAPYVYPAAAAGGLLATVDDIARFAAADLALTRAAGLSPEAIRRLHTPQAAPGGAYGVVADGYGFGHFLERQPDGRLAVWHGGQGTGWMTHFHAVPGTGEAIVILTNSQRSWPLIAAVLEDWAAWRGHGGVKMARIGTAVTVLWTLVALGAVLALWRGALFLRGLRRGERHFAPLDRHARPWRWLQIAFGTTIIALLGWAAAQPWLMVSSVFPGLAPLAGWVLLTLALLLVAAALWPRRRPPAPPLPAETAPAA